VARVICDISMSLDGFVAGLNQTLEQPLGEGGEGLHEWPSGWRAFAIVTAWTAARRAATTRS
jgi:hypothetical protein